MRSSTAASTPAPEPAAVSTVPRASCQRRGARPGCPIATTSHRDAILLVVKRWSPTVISTRSGSANSRSGAPATAAANSASGSRPGRSGRRTSVA